MVPAHELQPRMTSNIGKAAGDILGYEYDWLATDINGLVALFSTAGGGYAPEQFLRDTDAHDAAIDAILAIPATTQARFAPKLSPNLKNTWQQLAERGLFAFDSDPHGGPYRQVAAPVMPVHVDDLPLGAREVVRALTLHQARFDIQSIVSVELLR